MDHREKTAAREKPEASRTIALADEEQNHTRLFLFRCQELIRPPISSRSLPTTPQNFRPHDAKLLTPALWRVTIHMRSLLTAGQTDQRAAPHAA